jgi:hypothetical protein
LNFEVSAFKKITLVVIPSVRKGGEIVLQVYPRVRFGPRIGRFVPAKPEIWRFLDGHLVQVEDAGKWETHIY